MNTAIHMLRLICFLIGLSFLPAAPAQAASETDLQITTLPIASREINEASALSRSHRSAEVLWTLNDSGGNADIYALSTTGELLATVTLTGAGVINQDWEDMASFTQGDKHFLLIGDVGDNYAWRPNITFYLIKEPALPAQADVAKTPRATELKAPVLHTFRVQLPNGPRDIEAIAVDADENAAYLITKRDNRPTLYRFSLAHDANSPLTELMASDLGEISIPRADRNNGYFNWVTAMDFSESGRWAYVGTLSHGYRYARAPGQSWQEALQQQPIAFSQPRLTQIEGGCFDWRDEQQLFVISENLPAKMARIKLPAPGREP